MSPKISRYAPPAVLLALGIALLAYGAFEGSLQVYWVLVIPIFTGTGVVPLLGTLLVIVAVFLFFMGYARGLADQAGDQDIPPGSGRTPGGQGSGRPGTVPGTGAQPGSSGSGASGDASGPGSRGGVPGVDGAKRFGGVVLVGPVPIIFGSDKKTALALAVLAIIIIVLAILFMLLVWSR